MHPSTPRRRAHLHAPSGPGSLSASLFRQASAATQAATPAQKLAVVAILALFLLWNAATGGGEDGGRGGGSGGVPASAGGQLLSLAPPECESFLCFVLLHLRAQKREVWGKSG